MFHFTQVKVASQVLLPLHVPQVGKVPPHPSEGVPHVAPS
jgi:hypothetical protein